MLLNPAVEDPEVSWAEMLLAEELAADESVVKEEPAAEEPEAPAIEEDFVSDIEGQELTGDDIITEDQLPDNAKLIAEILDEMTKGRTISIYASYDGDELYFGDMVTLIAVLKGYDDCIFTAQWQQSKDDATWFDMVGENSLSCSFEVTEENYMDYWRIMIHISAVEIDDELLQSAAND